MDSKERLEYSFILQLLLDSASPMGNDTNSLPDLLELLLRVVPTKGKGKGKALNISPELRITKGIVDGEEDLCFEVAIKRVWLDLNLDGLDPISGTRFGEPVKDNGAEVKHKISHEVVKQGEAHADIGPSVAPSNVSGSLSGGARVKAAAKTVKSTTSTENILHLKVKARSNLRWEITESPQLEELDGTYLVGMRGEPLCKVSSKTGANFRSVQLDAIVKQRDVIFRPQKKKRLISFLNPTQEKMMQILIAKALSGTKSKFNGLIKFSRSELEIEEFGDRV